MRGQLSVIVNAFGCLRVSVYQRSGEARQPVQEEVLCLDGYLVCLDGGRIGSDHNLALGAQLMAEPTEPDVAYVQDSGHRTQRLFGLINKGRIDGVHQPTVDLSGRLAQHDQDRQCDDQPHDRVGPLPANGQAAHAQQNCQ